ncbi:hypothetical protein Dimus_021243 [Dionaea muscipula]
MCFSSFFNLKHTEKSSDQSQRHQSHDLQLPATPRTPTTPSSNYTPGSNKPSSSSTTSSTRSRHSLSTLTHSLADNPLIYDPSQILSATSRLRPLHRSSSSTSWRCLIDRRDVVVIQRKLRRPIDTSDLCRKLTLVCKNHHVSVVKLYGASVSGNYIHLVYEHVDGASLADCLNNPRNPNFTVLSNWLSRVRIAADIAHGLDYVHNCSGVRGGFVHNHIKSSSIMVTETALSAKLCHFGTAQLCGEVADEEEEERAAQPLKRTRSMKFEGTRGYMSPEFQRSGVPTLKSDVFAFGVVVLELVSGEQPLRMWTEGVGVVRTVSLIGTAREVVGSGEEDSSGGGGEWWGRLRKWVDRRLRDSYPVVVAEKLVRLAVECVEEDPGRRPDMNRVAGLISKLHLESENWAKNLGISSDITVSLAPR